MNRLTLTMTGLLSLLLLCACTKGKESEKAPPITTRERMLDCKDLQMEIHDANFIIYQAKKNRGFRAGNIFWPFGYGATFLSASSAISSAKERIGYLQKIYEIKGCHQPRHLPFVRE